MVLDRVAKGLLLSMAVISALLLSWEWMFDGRSGDDRAVLGMVAQQQALSQRTTKEVYHLISNPHWGPDSLEDAMRGFEQNLDFLMRSDEGRGIPLPPNIPVADALTEAQRAWEQVRVSIDMIERKQQRIALEIESFLQIVPELQEATEEVAFIVERRRLERDIIEQTRAQTGLLNLVILMASAYLAGSGDEHYQEFYTAMQSYEEVLNALVHRDGFVHGSILALASDNQIIWDRFQSAVMESVEGKRALILMQSELDQKGQRLNYALESALVAYQAYYQPQHDSVIHWIQILLLAAMVLMVLFLLYHLRSRSVVKRPL